MISVTRNWLMQSNMDMTDDIFRNNMILDNSIVPKYGAQWLT